jgi:hypothetical protein
MAKGSNDSNVTITVNIANGIGAALAAGLSYHMWHGFWLALGHAFCGWYYVFYHIFTYGFPIIRRY